MPIETGLLSYAALATLSLAVKKHRPKNLSALPHVTTARLAGWTLLALSALAAILRFGPALGSVAWVGQLCVSGALFVLLLSWRPQVALLLAGPALAMALIAAQIPALT